MSFVGRNSELMKKSAEVLEWLLTDGYAASATLHASHERGNQIAVFQDAQEGWVWNEGMTLGDLRDVEVEVGIDLYRGVPFAIIVLLVDALDEYPLQFSAFEVQQGTCSYADEKAQVMVSAREV